MYTIIGSDGAEYGPVSEAQIRAWMQAGRADLSTRVRRDGETEWTTIGELPEFLGGGHVPPVYAAAAAAAAGALPVDESSTSAEIAHSIFVQGGRIEIGNAFERAWAVLKANFWPILGVTLLMILIQLAIQNVVSFAFGGSKTFSLDDAVGAANQLSSSLLFVLPIMAIVQVLFSAGLQYYYLLHLRGEKPTIGDAFKGFSRPLPVICAGLLMAIFIWIGLLVLILPGIYLAVAFSYAPILVLDKQLPALKALEVSRRLVSRQWFTLFGMMLLCLLLMLAGVCALLIGVFIAMPLVGLAMVAAYDGIVNPKP